MSDATGGGRVKKLEWLNEQWHVVLRPLGSLLVDVFHYVGLFLIGAATVWAAGLSFVDIMMKRPHASIEDLLLLFIFLEIGAMVGIYFKTNHMPVRFLMYVAITAVTRHLISYVNHPGSMGLEVLVVAGTILLLSLALLTIRYASFTFPAGSARPATFKTDLDEGAEK
jgi:protein PsiE